MYETAQIGNRDEWIVYGVNEGERADRDRGEIYVAVFSGSLCEERAREYADWKNKAPSLAR